MPGPNPFRSLMLSSPGQRPSIPPRVPGPDRVHPMGVSNILPAALEAPGPEGGGVPTGQRWGRTALLAALLGGAAGMYGLSGGEEAAVAPEAQLPSQADPSGGYTGQSAETDPDQAMALQMALLSRILNEGRQRQNDIEQFGYVKTPRTSLQLGR